MIPFGARLIGQTEKSLNALLATVLADSGLTGEQWVALRLTGLFDGGGDLAAHIRDRARFSDPGPLLAALADRGLVRADRLTGEGRAFLGRTGRRIDALTAPVWERVSPDDAAGAERALNAVLEGTRAVLAAGPARGATAGA
ncbi:hypothetical protein [Nocardiopsis flavescens]